MQRYSVVCICASGECVYKGWGWRGERECFFILIAFMTLCMVFKAVLFSIFYSIFEIFICSICVQINENSSSNIVLLLLTKLVMMMRLTR